MLMDLGFAAHVASLIVQVRLQKVPYNAKLLPDIPILNGTLNIAEIAAMTNEEFQARKSEFVALLVRHVDAYDCEDGVSFIDIGADNMLYGAFEGDVPTDDELHKLKENPHVTLTEDPRRFRDPKRAATVKAQTDERHMVIGNLKHRVHCVQKGASHAA